MINDRVAVPVWVEQDDMADMIAHELEQLGRHPVRFWYSEPVPAKIGTLFTFGPYHKILPIWESAAIRPADERPRVIHWNTEGMPDLHIPYSIVRWVSALRSWAGRLSASRQPVVQRLASAATSTWAGQRLSRYRYTGDYEYAYKKGWLNVLGDSSLIYCKIRSQGGLPTLYAPWGGSKILYEDLNLERDIDVLWIGKRGTNRRSQILNRVCRELEQHGAHVHIADNVLNPFIFNGARTEYLNRARITLNITRTWYDDNFSRFVLAAPNRSLIVSEPVLEHCREFKPGVHYVSTPIPELARTILYYLEHPEAGQPIVENAHRLVTRDLLFGDTVKMLLEAAEKSR